jgi:hypothetical protein
MAVCIDLGLVDRTDAGMIQRRNRAGFLDQPLAGARFAEFLWRDELDRDVAVERRVRAR